MIALTIVPSSGKVVFVFDIGAIFNAGATTVNPTSLKENAMRKETVILAAGLVLSFVMTPAFADVLSSEEILASEQVLYSKEQMLAYVDSDEVQAKLIALGVDPAFAQSRVASMTSSELAAFNAQMQDMPAGGVVGAVVTVLAVIALLDLLGVTDVYPFIDPI